MSKTKESVPMGFTRETVPLGTHMCLIYSDNDERLNMISRFLEAGLAGNELVGYFADDLPPAETKKALLSRMSKKMPVDSGTRLDVRKATDVYCPRGHFEPEEMLANLRSLCNQAKKEGYASMRASGEMTWALRGIPGSERLVEYEALVNEVIASHPFTPICQYNANLFDGVTLFNILRVHPMMIVRGRVVHNPYYEKPREFLKSYLCKKR